MKIIVQIIFVLVCCHNGFGQITFNGCHDLFEDQDYVFSYIETDATGRNVYTTIPVDGEQTCGGIGTCEFKIQWNETSSVWEFLADDGNGDFNSPYVIYTNASPALPNPPSLNLGTWVENSAITDNGCGGDLSTANAVLTGDVQDEALSTPNPVLKDKLAIYPLPVRDAFQIRTSLQIDALVVYDLFGKVVVNKLAGFDNVDVSQLESGVYFLNITVGKKHLIHKITVR